MSDLEALRALAEKVKAAREALPELRCEEHDRTYREGWPCNSCVADMLIRTKGTGEEPEE